jgi:hypothetical protein
VYKLFTIVDVNYVDFQCSRRCNIVGLGISDSVFVADSCFQTCKRESMQISVRTCLKSRVVQAAPLNCYSVF